MGRGEQEGAVGRETKHPGSTQRAGRLVTDRGSASRQGPPTLQQGAAITADTVDPSRANTQGGHGRAAVSRAAVSRAAVG